MKSTFNKGDLVEYICPSERIAKMGVVTDILEDHNGWFVYEVVCTDPYDRYWFSDLELRLINESG